jgi:cation:H+ antiporter
LAGLGLLAVSAILLVAGSELFAENAAGAASKLQITLFGAAFLLAGAEPEELVTAVVAAARHRPGLAAGDAIGANITMLTLVLGLAALARPLPFGGRVRWYALWSAAAGGLAVAAVAGGQVGRWQGALLAAAYLAAVAVLWLLERRPPAVGELAEAKQEGQNENEQEDGRHGQPRSAGRAFVFALAGIGLMVAGGWLAVSGAQRVVADLGLTDSAVGLTLLALATTAELFALAWSATRRDIPEIAVAGVAGSVAYNATATLGAAALTQPLAVTGMLVPALLAAALPLAVLVLAPRGRLGRPAGALLVVVYLVFAVTQLSP